MTGLILVLGASGPIGASVMKHLKAANLPAIGLSRSTEVSLDVRDRRSVRQAFLTYKPEQLIYLAGPTAIQLSADASLSEAYIQSTAHVLETAYSAGCRRMLLASSAATYGTEYRQPILESHSLNGTGNYSELKKRSEQLLNNFAKTHPFFEASSLRLFNVYGPGCHDSLVEKVRTGTAEVWDTDSFVRDYVHVDDVAQAFVQAATSSTSLPVAMNVGTGKGISNAELLRLVPDTIPVDRLPYSGLPSTSISNIELARRSIRFIPQHQLSARYFL